MQRFLDMYSEISGELPDPTQGQVMERCQVRAEYNGHTYLPLNVVCCYCIPLQHVAYVVHLSSTASPAPAVIAVTAKIQIGPMTMIGKGVGEEVVWRRFYTALRDGRQHGSLTNGSMF